ncbi:transporter substrate-binding domain-containing protein [Enterococcus timonensis]|uniref:transporter substrate-binding domain-containing protein n=1 Tax=Enterococcus timonensis TaxID=1852364 RepID=UPI0008D95D37|nr:transporter substrate-binding domain-containing protein [Enterococcus timonensis]
MKKILATLLTASSIFLLAACSSTPESSTDTSSTPNANTADNTTALADIKEAGELVIGTSPDFAPFEFPMQVDGKNEIVGVDIDIAQAVADSLGVDLKIMQLDFDNLLPSMQAGKLDMVLAGISATEERQASADFSTPYFTPSQKVVINKKDLATYTTPESLAGKNVGAQKGSIQEDVAKEQLADANLILIPKNTTMLIQISSGGLDAMVLEGAVAEAYVKQNTDLAIADIELTSSDDESYAIALPKNSGDLKTEVDKVINDLIENDKINEIVQKNSELADENAQ